MVPSHFIPDVSFGIPSNLVFHEGLICWKPSLPASSDVHPVDLSDDSEVWTHTDFSGNLCFRIPEASFIKAYNLLSAQVRVDVLPIHLVPLVRKNRLTGAFSMGVADASVFSSFDVIVRDSSSNSVKDGIPGVGYKYFEVENPGFLVWESDGELSWLPSLDGGAVFPLVGCNVKWGASTWTHEDTGKRRFRQIPEELFLQIAQSQDVPGYTVLDDIDPDCIPVMICTGEAEGFALSLVPEDFLSTSLGRVKELDGGDFRGSFVDGPVFVRDESGLGYLCRFDSCIGTGPTPEAALLDMQANLVMRKDSTVGSSRTSSDLGRSVQIDADALYARFALLHSRLNDISSMLVDLMETLDGESPAAKEEGEPEDSEKLEVTYSVSDAAKLLGISDSAVRQAIYAGRLPAGKNDAGTWRITILQCSTSIP